MPLLQQHSHRSRIHRIRGVAVTRLQVFSACVVSSDMYGSQLDRNGGVLGPSGPVGTRTGFQGRSATVPADMHRGEGASRSGPVRFRGPAVNSMLGGGGRHDMQHRGGHRGGHMSDYKDDLYRDDHPGDFYGGRSRSKDMYEDRDRWELEPREPYREPHESYRESRALHRHDYYSSPPHRCRSPDRQGEE